MATSDKAIYELTEAVAKLGAPNDIQEMFREAMYSIVRLGIAEHQADIESAEGAYLH